MVPPLIPRPGKQQVLLWNGVWEWCGVVRDHAGTMPGPSTFASQYSVNGGTPGPQYTEPVRGRSNYPGKSGGGGGGGGGGGVGSRAQATLHQGLSILRVAYMYE